MITILRSTDLGLERMEDLADGCWVNLVNPGPDEIAHLNREYGIPQDFITFPLDLDERPRTEREDSVILIVLRVPVFNGEGADVPYATIPLGIVLTDRVIVTVCKTENGIIQEMASGRIRGLTTTKRNRFILYLFLATANRYLLYLREINRKVEALEDQLQASLRNREVLEMLKYQKSLTYFTTALRSNMLMIGRLERSQLFRQYPDDEDLLDDVMTELGQALEMTEISSGILSQMMDAFASIISNNLNVVMKFLASVTIILSLPTLVASIYGMNIDLPLDAHPLAFPIVMGITAVLTIITVIIFLRKDWL